MIHYSDTLIVHNRCTYHRAAVAREYTFIFSHECSSARIDTQLAKVCDVPVAQNCQFLGKLRKRLSPENRVAPFIILCHNSQPHHWLEGIKLEKMKPLEPDITTPMVLPNKLRHWKILTETEGQRSCSPNIYEICTASC